MVTAGVYLLSRMHTLFILSDVAMVTIAVTGIATALFAASIGLMQNDIKRVLAYSTISQLGYMFAACGAGVFAAGMFHVMTHAFFKACLFLGSGSVIHAVEHAMHAAHDNDHAPVDGLDPNDPQDMRNMGGLFPRIKVTAVCMIAATAAICGIWPFAGYYSKDEILFRDWATMVHGDWLFWGVGFLTALLTAFYMVRMVMKTFFGAPRTTAAKNAHESGPLMLIPIGILAVLSLIAGWPILPLNFEKFSEFLAPSVGVTPAANPLIESELGLGTLAAIALVIVYCIFRYRSTKNNELMAPDARANRTFLSPGWLNWAILNKYFVDEAYNFWFVRQGKIFSQWLWRKFDLEGVDGIVNGVGALTAWSGQRVRRFQNGYVRSYAFSMVVGILLVLIGCLVGIGHK